MKNDILVLAKADYNRLDKAVHNMVDSGSSFIDLIDEFVGFNIEFEDAANGAFDCNYGSIAATIYLRNNNVELGKSFEVYNDETGEVFYAHLDGDNVESGLKCVKD